MKRREYPSAYGQMGRCLSPCLGDLDPNAYRRRLDEALALFTGDGDGGARAAGAPRRRDARGGGAGALRAGGLAAAPAGPAGRAAGAPRRRGGGDARAAAARAGGPSGGRALRRAVAGRRARGRLGAAQRPGRCRGRGRSARCAGGDGRGADGLLRRPTRWATLRIATTWLAGHPSLELALSATVTRARVERFAARALAAARPLRQGAPERGSSMVAAWTDGLPCSVGAVGRCSSAFGPEPVQDLQRNLQDAARIAAQKDREGSPVAGLSIVDGRVPGSG